MIKYLIYIFISCICIIHNVANADIWIDEDRESFVEIKNNRITINSLNSFYFFDQIFTNVRKNDTKIRLCLGENIKGIPKDCTDYMKANPFFYNHGKNRAISLDIDEGIFLIQAVENYLKHGKIMKISIDDNDLYAAYILNKKFTLNRKSLKILKLNN